MNENSEPTTSLKEQDVLIIEVPAFNTTETNINAPTEGTADIVAPTEDTDQILTQKFLNGEISFTEYESHIQDEPEDQGDEDVDQPSVADTATDNKCQEKPKRPKTRKPLLPLALKGLMGEANLRYARGDIETAEKMCLEVIRQVPTAPEPFLTLAQIYETDNPQKSMQFNLIAAYLHPSNAEQWIRLGEQSEEIGNFKQAINCYTKAITADPSKIDVHRRRIALVENTGEKKLALRHYLRLLKVLKLEDGAEYIISLAKEVAQKLHFEGDLIRAVAAMDVPFKTCPHLLTPEHINIMLELLIAHGDLSYCIDILIQHCNISIELELDDGTDNDCKVVSYVMPDSLQIDFKIKFTIILIRMKAFHLMDQLLEPILIYEKVEEIGDLFLDVAEELMAVNRHIDALKLIIPLLKIDSYSLAAVWLKHADCLNACNLKEEAIVSYYKVIHLAPQHAAVRHTLSELLISLGRKEEAVIALAQDETVDVDVSLLLKRANLLREQKRYDEYFAACILLLSRHANLPRNRDELHTLICHNSKPSMKSERLKAMRTFRCEDPVDVLPTFSTTAAAPSYEEEYQHFKEIVALCMQLKRYNLMQKFAFLGMSSPKFKHHTAELEVICVWACVFNEDSTNGYNIIREMLQRKYNNVKLWNLFNLVIANSDDLRRNRFIMRLLSNKTDMDSMIRVIHANNCLVAGTYKYALSEYMETFRIKQHPLIALLIALTLFQMACQKYTAQRESLLIQGVAFMSRYKELRGPDALQEVNYNTGRTFHQLGVPHLAAHYYNLVLEHKHPLIEQHPTILDLKREAAFNLHLLYVQSKSYDLAEMVLVNYLTI